MVTKAELERLKIDIVDELHEIRSKYAGTPPKEIEKVAAETLKEIEKRRKK